MIAVDTSVAVASFGEWHRLHEPALAILDEGAAIPAHGLLETWSVLTGFPPPHRAPADVVSTWLDDRFARILEPPPASAQRDLVHDLARAGRIGGVVYDALVGVTARAAGLTLVTADRRAANTYALVDVDHRLLE